MKFVSAYTSLTENKEELCCPDLTYNQRLIGFCVCFVLGLLIELASFGSIVGLVSGNPTRFAILFSIGNIISITGTFFLVGPKKQFKNMTDKKRLITTLVFVGSVIMTIVSVIFFENWVLTLVFVLIQFAAYIWYVLSYIPYGRECCTGCLKNLCCSKTAADL